MSSKKSSDGLPPPHSEDAERGLLCSVIIDPVAIRKVEWVKPKWFYIREHRIIWQACLDLSHNDIGIDTLTLYDRLNATANMVNGNRFLNPTYLMELSNEQATAAHVSHYAKIVRECAIKRGLLFHCSRTINTVHQEDISKIIISMAGVIDAAQQVMVSGTTVPMDEATMRTLDVIKKLTEDMVTGRTEYLKSGLPYLDYMLGGFEPKTLTLIAARPSTGKSDLMISWAYHMSTRTPVCIFSLEMSEPAITRRMLSLHTGISRMKMKTGELDESEMDELYRKGDVGSRPIFYDFTSNTVPLIKGKVLDLIRLRHIGVVFIDHFHKLNFHTNHSGDLTNRRAVLDGIYELAQSCNIPVIMLVQLGRESEALQFKSSNKSSKVPTLRHLREVGEEQADVVIMLFRELYQQAADTDTLELHVRKSRDGGLGRVDCHYNLETGKIAQLEKQITEEIPIGNTNGRQNQSKDEPAPF